MNKTEHCVGYYLNESAEKGFELSARMLEDGSVLSNLLEKLKEAPCDKTLLSVMRCLRDSSLYVGPNLDQTYSERGRIYLKAYPAADGSVAEKRRRFAALDLIKHVVGQTKYYGIAIDPEKAKFLLGPDFMEIVSHLPSEL